MTEPVTSARNYPEPPERAAMKDSATAGGLLTPGRECGSCRLCCTVLDVLEEDVSVAGRPAGRFHVPEGQPCEFSSPSGCRIHATAPSVCRTFRCLWLEGYFADRHRPDRVGWVPVGWVRKDEDPEFPDSAVILYRGGHVPAGRRAKFRDRVIGTGVPVVTRTPKTGRVGWTTRGGDAGVNLLRFLTRFRDHDLPDARVADRAWRRGRSTRRVQRAPLP